MLPSLRTALNASAQALTQAGWFRRPQRLFSTTGTTASAQSQEPRDSRRHLNPLKQLIDLPIAQLLAQGGKDVSQFALADVAVVVFVEHLEAADEFV